jgi:hypothetical protein
MVFILTTSVCTAYRQIQRGKPSRNLREIFMSYYAIAWFPQYRGCANFARPGRLTSNLPKADFEGANLEFRRDHVNVSPSLANVQELCPSAIKASMDYLVPRSINQHCRAWSFMELDASQAVPTH